MSDLKRQEIKSRIAAAHEREQALVEKSTGELVVQKASDATDAFTGFVRQHPLASAAGGIVLGVLVASMFKGPRQAAARGGARAIGLATIGSEMAGAFANELLDDAKDLGTKGVQRAEDIGDAVGDKARAVRRDAGYHANRTSDAARIASRETGKRIARAFRSR